MAKVYARGRGTTIKYGTLGTTPATVLSQVREINGLPTGERGDIEITGIADEDKEFVSGDRDPGTVEFKLGFDEDEVDDVYGLDGVQSSFLITYSTGATHSFDGFIKKIGTEFTDNKGEIRIPVTIRLSGAVVFTPAA